MSHLPTKNLIREALTADIGNYNQRIAAGKVKEKMIVDQLRKYGVKIDDPTQQEDMYDKIDGWMYDSKGVKNSVQIKFRESGDDIIFEMVKDLDKNIPGRDMISKAQLYLVVDRTGAGKLINTDSVKKKAQELLKVVESDLEKNPNKTRWSNVGWEVKITQDRAHGQNKLMGYFNPKMFTIIHNWKFAL
jgi:hypothetical protein